jgi:hypothetical protein
MWCPYFFRAAGESLYPRDATTGEPALLKTGSEGITPRLAKLSCHLMAGACQQAPMPRSFVCLVMKGLDATCLCPCSRRASTPFCR